LDKEKLKDKIERVNQIYESLLDCKSDSCINDRINEIVNVMEEANKT